ncbi:MAG: hypothetical protein ABTD50_15090 [Polyangiaceae bacterium]|jgi:Rod binding domain-containing protein
MSTPISPVTLGVATTPSASNERAVKLHKAASEFESLLVKQMLKQSNISGEDKANGYADMAVDAMASAVEKGGGLGLVRSIEAAIRPRAGLSDATKQPSKR